MEAQLVGSFSKIGVRDLLGLPCAMYTCVGSKYTHLVPAPTAKGTICFRSSDSHVRGTLLGIYV
jgi:hypothetical protein